MQSVLEFIGVSKRFGGIQALDGVSLSVEKGHVHALLGENGAGKSTLMKALVGAVRKDTGRILLDGREVNFSSPAEARQAGIVQIFQELTIIPELSVAKNIFLSREHAIGPTGLLRHRRMNRLAEEFLAQIGIHIDVTRPASEYSAAQQQMIEIARALSCQARIIVMDEPTSSLSAGETNMLFQVIRRITAAGTTIIYISHRMNEILEIAHRGTVLRDGKVVGEVDITPQSDKTSLVRMMIGRSWQEEFPERHSEIGEPLLEVERLSRHGAYHDVSLTVRRGEVVGLFGLLGAGRTEAVRGIFGADPHTQGRIALEGKPFRPRSPRDSIDRGLVLIPEDRKRQGLILGMSVGHNAALPILEQLSAAGLLNQRRLRARIGALASRLRIKTPSLSTEAYSLSGGNQQKVVLAKWLAKGARVFLFDEPTRGIDVESKREIYCLLNELAESGHGVLLISSESEEILGMCDRILVMFKGRVQAELVRSEASEEKLILHAMGN